MRAQMFHPNQDDQRLMTYCRLAKWLDAIVAAV